jgi:membrane protein implicated in regulation of membrane protease activity
MKSLNSTSARAFIWLAAIVVVLGFLVSSPSGAFLAFLIATLVAFVPALFASGKIRVIAVILLLASIGLAASKYASFRDEQQKYRDRAAGPGSR